MDVTDYNRKIKPLPFAVLCASFVLFASYIGASDSKLLSFAVLLSSLLVIFGFLRSTVCALILIIPSFIIGLYVGKLEIALLLCSLQLAIGVGAFVIRMLGKKAYLFLLLLPLSCLIAFLIKGSLSAALLTVTVFPASYICAHFTKSKKSRLASICAISVSLGICALGFLAAYVLTVYTGTSPFSDAAQDLFDFLLKYYTDEHLRLAEKYTQAGIDPSLLGLTASDARLYAISVFGIVPALALILLNGISFVSHRVNITLLDNAELIDKSDLINLVFSMSPVSAILYIAAYLVMTFASYSGSASADITGLIAQNIYLILLPGLTLTGILFLTARIVRRRRNVLWAIAIGLVAFSSVNLALSVTAFLGSAFILLVFFRRIASSRNDG